jgi:hypothetical protein
MAEPPPSKIPFVERMPRPRLVWNNHSMAWISARIAGIVENKAPRWWWVAILRHTSGQVAKNILHCNSHAANTRFAAALAGLNSDDFRVIHGRSLVQHPSSGQPGPEGCDENGPAASGGRRIGHVSVQICSLLAPVRLGPPCRRPILIATPLHHSLTRCTISSRRTTDFWGGGKIPWILLLSEASDPRSSLRSFQNY